MKKRTFVIAFCLVLICAVFMFSGCFLLKKREIKYYSDDNNYVTENGTVESITYSGGNLKLGVAGRNYVIIKSSEEILRENNFYEEVRIYSEITYVIASSHFADRINYIFAIEYNGKTYLDFETGKNNVLDYLRS